MSERDVLACPFCGAPYTEAIPRDVVNVKCKYCKSIILLPSNLSIVPRCPNHTDTIALGLCNRCMQAFCKKCLHYERRNGENIYLCSNCLESRKKDRAYGLIAVGVAMFFVSLFAVSISIFLFLVLFIVLSLPFIAGGLYVFSSLENTSNLAVSSNLQQLEESAEERRLLGAASVDVESLYWRLWKEYVRGIGVNGPALLEKRIHDYMKDGLTLEEAIKRLAKFERI